jgi:hypothetical protein
MQLMTAGTVTKAMKRLGVVSALAAAVIAVWYLQRPRTASEAPADEPLPVAAELARTGSAPSPGTSPPVRPAVAVSTVTRLASTDERRELAKRIADARASRAAIHAPPRPQLPEQPEEALSPPQIRDAMRAVIPHLAACYRTAVVTLPSASLSIVAEITLTGDPDVGTLIDAKELVDDTGQPLPAAFDDCLRSTFFTLALPPLAEGDQLEVRYPFMFSSL